MLKLPPVSAWIRCVSILGLAYIGLLSTGISSAARAATPAGTEILNQATATFEWLGRSHIVTSNLVSNAVLPVHGLVIKPDGTVPVPGLLATASPGATVYLPYTLLNTGNTTDSFRLSLVFLSEPSSFEPGDRRLFIDLDGDGVLSPQEAAVSVDRVNNVPAGGLIYLIAQVRIPAATPNGSRAFFDLRGRSLADATAIDENNIARITLSEDPVLRLRKSSDRPSVQGGGVVTYTLDVLHVSGTPALGDLPVVDGAPRRGILLSDPIPEFITAGTNYVSGSLAVEYAGAERIYSTDDGLTWRSFSALGGEPAAASVTHVGVLFPGPFAAGQSARARFQVRVAADHAPGRIGNRADLRYRAADERLLTDATTNEIFVEVLPTFEGVFIGPAADPRRFGETSTNDDSTLDGGVNFDAIGPYQVVGNFVFFRNTVENASRVPDVVNIDVVADDSMVTDPAAAPAARMARFARAAASRQLTTLPAGWVVQLLSADGSRTLLDTNRDGTPDVGTLPAGGRADIIVRVLIPPGFVPPPAQPDSWQVLVRAASAAEPARANLTINRIPRVLLADEFWRTFGKTFDAPAVILPGTPITYTNRFGHGGSAAVTNAIIIDNLSDRLVNARAITAGSITSLDGSITISGVTAEYDPVANRIVWLIPVVPPGFIGELRFTADVAADTTGGTEIPNEFTISSDQSTAVRVSNLVSTVVNAPAVLVVEKEVNRENASIGDPVLYTVTVANAGPVPLISAASLVDDLPRGFRYLDGSARLDGARLEPVIDPSGTSLTWPLGDLALGDTRTVTYVTIPSIDALKGDGRNVATATGTFPGGGTGVASDVAVVELEGGPFDNRSVILGRVFVDENADGAFTPGERGLADVRLVLDDGVTVLTDRDGLYHIEGVTPGIRAFRLDESTLPPGHTPAVLDSQNALNPSSRFLDLRFGVLHRANFAVLPPLYEIVRIEKTAPTDAVLLAPTFLSEEGATHVTVRWTGPATPTHRINLNNGTVSLFFPGVVQTDRKTNEPVDELNVDRYRIHTDHEQGYSRLDLRLRKRTSGYPSDFVRVGPAADGELRVSLGGAAVADDDAAARASAAVESALHAVGTPAPAPELASLQGPVVHEPAEGTAFISRDKISVRVSAHLASGFELYVNDEPVSKEQIGEKSIHVKARRSFYEYVSVPIAPGPNKLRFETKGPSAQETGVVELTVFRAADPEKIELVVTDDQLVADGRSEPVIGVVLRDASGFATGEATVVTIEMSGGQILSPDFRPMEPGHQAQIREGRALLRLSAANQAETRTLTVTAGTLKLREELVLRPALRDWILVGSADATASLTDSRESATRTRALRDETRETIESGLRVFGQGRFIADSLLTFSYDSERQYDDYPIFRQFQEDDYYPVYGDTSKIFPEAASRAKLYARLEKDQSYVMFGDIDTEMQETELAAHSRRLTGAKADIKTDWFDFKGFISHTEQARVREEIPAGGVSYYQLQDRDVIPGSEEIWLEVRDRARPSEVVRREQLSRGRDYSFDYSFGRILFKRPITSRDGDFNPQVIVVNYEKDGRTGEKQYTFGGRPAVHDPDRRVTVGATYLEEENGFFSDKVEGVDATVQFDEKTTVRGEYAETNTLEEGFGRGHLIEIKREEEKTSYRVYHSDLDDTFDNPGLRGSPVGRRLTGAEAIHYFTPRVSGELEAYDQIDAVGGRTLRVGLADLLYEGDNYKLGVGGGYVTQEEEADSEFGAESRESPLLRLQAGYAFNSRFDVEGEYQHAFGDRDTEQPTRGAVTFGYQLFDNTRLQLGMERRYVTGEGMADNLLFGTEVTVNDHVSVFNKYELDAGQSGQAGRANSGVAFKYPVRPDLRVDLTGEVNNTLHETGRAPLGREFWSLASGFEYTPNTADYTVVGRHEYKWQPDRREHFNELGGTVKVLDDHTAFARNRISYAEVTAPEQYDEWIARVLFGWAYRPLFEDRLNVISSLEFNYERTASANLARIQDVLSSHEFTYQTAPDWILEGKYAFKAAWGDFLDDTVWTDVKALRLRYDFTRRFYGAVGVRLLSQYDTDVHTLGYGVEAGFVVRKDFIIALGWNFEGFYDRRFSAGDHWDEGAYLAFRVKFDESLFGVLNQLRGRSATESDAAGSSASYNLNAAPPAP